MNNFTDKPPTYDIEKNEKLVFNLFTLTEGEKEELKSRVLESKGIVRAMVHPYYISQLRFHDPEVLPYYNMERVDLVQSGFERILKANPNAPVLIFEARNFIPETTHKIKPILEKSKNQVYFVPTFPGNSLPRILDIENNEDEWSVLIKLLQHLGVKKIIIGGMLLNVHKIDGKEVGLSGCAGIAINNLSEHFDVQISAITSPESRKDVENPNIKATK